MEKSYHQHPNNPDVLKTSSPRSFGLTFSLVFILIGLWPLFSQNPVHLWSLGVASLLVTISALRPQVLALPNHYWLKLGLLLNKIVSPVILSSIYFIVFAPVGLVFKLFGKDLLALRLDDKVKTYWILREPPGPKPETMVNQF